MPVSIGDLLWCNSSLNRHNVTKTGSDWSLFSHRGPVNEVANGAKKSSGIRGIVLQHRVVAGKASDVVLARPESRTGTETRTRLPILRGMSGEGEGVL